ncbi:MAG: TPM domain-containing protein [Blastomonas sp.]
MLLVAALALPAHAQNFPELTGRVVDNAELLDEAQEAALSARLEALEGQSGRQLVVATIPNLEGYEIEDYGYRLGREWGIGDKERNDGTLLIVAPNERKVRIEVGYGLEGIMTDALSSIIIQNDILPRFRDNDYPGGINAGADAIISQLTLPEDEARAYAAQVGEDQRSSEGSGNFGMLIFWGFILFFFILPAIFGSRKGKRYRRSGAGPIIVWGPSAGSSWGSSSSSGGSSWSSGGGGGGFSGGGGSFGGGGASGGW